MGGTTRGGKKAAKTLLAKDPDHFRKLALRAKKPRGGKASPGSFKTGNRISIKGGSSSKRGKGKMIDGEFYKPVTESLQYEDVE